MELRHSLSVIVLFGLWLPAASAIAAFAFSTGSPDGRLGAASHPASASAITIESADDFVLESTTTLDQATFTGLLPAAMTASDITDVSVDIYRVFPQDSAFPPSGNVPSRANSPSDVAFTTRGSAAASLTFSAAILSATFTVANSIVNGIHKVPNSLTGGEGAATGVEVLISIGFTTPITLAAGHYFVVPRVGLATGDFLWLSAPRPIVAPGTPFAPDFEGWIRDANLAPDWLRIGTDIVGGATPPVFNGAFSLGGVEEVAAVPTAVPVPTLGSIPLLSLLLGVGAAGMLGVRRRSRRGGAARCSPIH